MILFLTSSPCDDNVPEGCELLCIYFERNAFVANLRKYVAPGVRFLVIAAWPDDHDRNDEMAQTFAGCFRWHGMGFADVDVLDSRNQERAAELVAATLRMLSQGVKVCVEIGMMAMDCRAKPSSSSTRTPRRSAGAQTFAPPSRPEKNALRCLSSKR